jgi:hypothetical protein
MQKVKACLKKHEQEENGTNHLLTLMDEFYGRIDLLTNSILFFHILKKKKNEIHTDSCVNCLVRFVSRAKSTTPAAN